MPTFHSLKRRLKSTLDERGGAGALYVEGWLWKAGQFNPQMTRRWCVLTADGMLRYCEDRRLESMHGSFMLQGAKVAASAPEEGQLRLTVTPSNRHRSGRLGGAVPLGMASRDYEFAAPSAAEGAAWLQAMLMVSGGRRTATHLGGTSPRSVKEGREGASPGHGPLHRAGSSLAKRPCPANCGFVVTWPVSERRLTHCCSHCAKGLGGRRWAL